LFVFETLLKNEIDNYRHWYTTGEEIMEKLLKKYGGGMYVTLLRLP